MALISISKVLNNLGNKIAPSSGSAVEFDGFMSVSPTITNIVTRRPVEDGYDLNDAVHNKAQTLSVEIIVTDTPQGVLDSRSVSNLPNVFGVRLLKSHVQRQLDNLEAISRNKVTISLTSKYRIYEGYFIESISYSEDSDQGLRISFDLVESRTNAVFNPNKNISPTIGLWS